MSIYSTSTLLLDYLEHSVSAAEAKPASEIALPLPMSELERLLGWGTVADAEQLMASIQMPACSGIECLRSLISLNEDITDKDINMQEISAAAIRRLGC